MSREVEPLLGSINQEGASSIPSSSSSSSVGGNSSMLSSVVNLTNTILGAGLLALPFAFRLSGLGLGLLFLIFVWLFSALSFDVLGRAAQLTGLFTYKEIALKAYGKPLAIISELCILLYTFLSLVSRPIILSSYLVTVFASWTYPNVPYVLGERWFFIVVVLLIIFPLTFLRNIDALKCKLKWENKFFSFFVLYFFFSFLFLFFFFLYLDSSFFSLICILFASIVVYVMFAQTPNAAARLLEVKFFPDTLSGLATSLISLGIMVVSFCAHYNAPRMYQELQARSVTRWRLVVIASTSICFLAYASVGVMGYMTCLTFTEDNVLDDYGQNVVIVTVARLCLSVAIIFSTPLVLFACRRAFLAVFLPSKVVDTPFWLWITISGSLLGLSGVIAYLLPSISIIFGFSGAIVG